MEVTMRVLFGLMMVFLFGCASAQSAEFSHLGTVKVAQLNEILSAERAKFLPADSMGAQYQYPQAGEAKNDVEIYRVSYDSVIPELNNKPVRASGLVAIPKSLQSKAAPIISYQHGTVFGKYEVPSYAFETRNPSGHSHYDGAYETRLMVAQFAGNGYILMAADYFGLGDSTASEGYMVKASSQQACNDFYHAVIKFLADKHIQPTSFYLGGWSQGGLVTTGFLQKLETDGVKVDAAFTASSPNDPYAAIIGRVYYPRDIDAVWMNATMALTVFSYENYFSLPQLGRSVIKDQYYDDLKRLYTRDYDEPEGLEKIFRNLLANGPVPFKAYFRDEYEDPAYFAASQYGKLLASAETYRQLFKTPLKMFYGNADEVIAFPVGELAWVYQKTLGGDAVSKVLVPGANHRATFLTAVSQAKVWFDTVQKHSDRVAK